MAVNGIGGGIVQIGKAKPGRVVMVLRRIKILGQIFYQGQYFLYWRIRNPYYTAGKKYGWQDNSPGIGINESALRHAKFNKLQVRTFIGAVDHKCYEADPLKWLELKCIEQRAVRLFHYPLKEMKPIDISREIGRLIQ